MPRVLVATQPWGVIQTPAGRVVNAATATITTTVYSASTGSGTVGAFQTNTYGELPGYVEAGQYTLTVQGRVFQVEAVSSAGTAGPAGPTGPAGSVSSASGLTMPTPDTTQKYRVRMNNSGQVVVEKVPLFDPTTVTGLQFDLNPHMDLGDAQDGDAVGTLAGTGLTMSQSTALNKPTFRVGLANGFSGLQFGTNSFMNSTAAITPRHIFIVAKYDAATFPGGINPGLISGISASTQMLVGVAGDTKFYDGSGITYHKDGTSYVDTNLQAPMNAYAVMSLSKSSWASTTIQLGDDRSLSRWWVGSIIRVLGYSSVLSSTDRATVQNGLKGDYGTP